MSAIYIPTFTKRRVLSLGCVSSLHINYCYYLFIFIFYIFMSITYTYENPWKVGFCLSLNILSLQASHMPHITKQGKTLKAFNFFFLNHFHKHFSIVELVHTL
jgi:hypothetical protein